VSLKLPHDSYVAEQGNWYTPVFSIFLALLPPGGMPRAVWIKRPSDAII
jgi:hypothetical protein